jgi:hypothetical protein
MWSVQKVPKICLINIFLYLELAEGYPLQNSPRAHQFTSPAAFSTFEALLKRCLWCRLQVTRTCHDSFFRVLFLFALLIYCRDVFVSVSCVKSSAAAQLNNANEATL